MPGKDFKREHKALYTAKAGRIDEVDVPALDYLMLDGRGDPAREFGSAMHALYSVAYPLKFMIRARDAKLDYVVMPPEALYPGKPSVYQGPREKWPWTLLVLQPARPAAAELRDAKERALEKGAPPVAKKLRLERMPAHRAVQTLHVGPYEKSTGTIEAMHAYMEEHGFRFGGAHHEVYLSDPQRVAPEKIKTIMRQPVVAKRIARIAVATR